MHLPVDFHQIFTKGVWRMNEQLLKWRKVQRKPPWKNLRGACIHPPPLPSRLHVRGLRTNSCHSPLRRNTAGKWHTTRQHQQKDRIQVDTLDLDWSTQQLCMTFTWSKVQMLRVMRREKIAFFAFHAFVVEDSRFQQNRVRAKLYNCGGRVCKSNVEIRISGFFCRPQLIIIETTIIVIIIW